MSLVLDATYGQGWMQSLLGIEAEVNMDLDIGKHPHVSCDFRCLPLQSGSCRMVLFDPPYIPWRGPPNFVRAWGYWPNLANMRKGLYLAWREIDRVLDDGGTCVFKWGTTAKKSRVGTLASSRELTAEKA